MKLSRLRISHLRSIAAVGPAMDVPLGTGCNVFVGPNGCGKSSVLRAVELAVDPAGHRFDPGIDVPWPVPVGTAVAGNNIDTADASLSFIEAWWTTPPGVAPNPHAPARQADADSGQSGGPALVVTHHVDNVAVATAPPVRCLAIPGEHHRRTELLAGIELLLTLIDPVSPDGANRTDSTDTTGVAERLTRGLIDIVGDDVTVDLTSGCPAAMTIVSTGRRRSPGELTTPELLTVLVTLLTVTASASQERSATSWILAVDQPETGLHPAAQRRLAAALDALASAPNVTVVFSSHSPFMIPRTPDTLVFELATDNVGATTCISSVSGDGPLAEVVDSLFDDPVLPDILDRAATIDDGAAGILVVEGDTDTAYIKLACTLAGRPELFTDLHIAASHGTRRMVLDALTLRSLAGDRPLCVLVDHDSEGRSVAHLLTGRLGFRNTTEVVSVAVVFDERWRGHEWDAEDLLPPALLAEFVNQHDEELVLRGKTKRPDELWHWDLTAEGKAMLPDWLELHATADDLALWLELTESVRHRMGLNPHDTNSPDPSG